ncbi:uncharacterized protein JCM6883_003710 [Sporobolomyces salmoneus]|uniref:uncharacterized protein n=1 Tax=Sporobolomyces salmoneus TaxID=183962 RepID=UPI003180EAD3
MPSSSKNSDSALLRAANVLSRSTSKIKFFRSISPNPTRPSSPSPPSIPVSSPTPSRRPSTTPPITVLHRRASPCEDSSRISHKRKEESSAPPSLFTNLNPFASLPQEVEETVDVAPSKHPRIGRRHSSELRAAAANRFKLECKTGQPIEYRRQSLVDVDTVTDRLRSRRLSSLKGERRCSSASRRRRSSIAPRQFEPLRNRSISPTDSLLLFPDSPTSSPLPLTTVSDRRCAFSDENPSLTTSFETPATPSTRSPSLTTSFLTQTDTDVSEFETPAVDDVEIFPLNNASSSPPAPFLNLSLPSRSSPRFRPAAPFHLDLSPFAFPRSLDRRRSTTSSSYRPDHLVLTPGTICLCPTPNFTSRSNYTSEDIFSDAFADALKNEKSEELSNPQN